MPVEIDGVAVLGAIARHPDAFPALASEMVRTARLLVVKQLKDKKVTLVGVRQVAAAIDRVAFDLVTDALSDGEIRSLLGRIDRHYAELRTAQPTDLRQHLAALVTGSADLSAKAAPVKASKPPPPAKPAVERAGNSKAMRARRRV